jgi:hypothetical protein
MSAGRKSSSRIRTWRDVAVSYWEFKNEESLNYEQIQKNGFERNFYNLRNVRFIFIFQEI